MVFACRTNILELLFYGHVKIVTSDFNLWGTEMAGPKKYNWKDSNLALFGSDLERKVSTCTHYRLVISITIHKNIS